MREIGAQYNVSVAQVALAWVRQQPGVTSTIIGAKSLEQLNDNLKSLEVTLSVEDLRRIDDVSPLPLQYPGWMVKRHTLSRD